MGSIPDFEKKFKLAVKQEKMTSERMDELLLNIVPILEGRSVKEDQIEIDIQIKQHLIYADSLSVDLAVFFLSKNATEDGYMDASIATGVAKITNARSDKIAMAQGFLLKLIDTSLQGLDVPGGDE